MLGLFACWALVTAAAADQIGRRLLFASLASAAPHDIDKVPDCPIETAGMKSEGSKPVHWKLHNLLRVPLQLFWVSFEGIEQKMEKLGPGSETAVATYEGHAWRMRSPKGVLIAEAVASPMVLKLLACRQMYGSDAVTLPTSLAHAAGAMGPAVRSHWQGDALAAALAECNPWQWLSKDVPFIGFHVLCVEVGNTQLEVRGQR